NKLAASAIFIFADSLAFALLDPPVHDNSRMSGRRHHLITASVGTPHTVLDAALNRINTLLLKPKAGTDVALAGLFALLAGFVAESLRVCQVILRPRSAPIILVIKVTRPIRVIILR